MVPAFRSSECKRSREPDSDDDDGGPVERRSRVPDDHPLLLLVDQRRQELCLLLEHIADLQEQLVVAKRKLEESKTLLRQLRGEAAEETIAVASESGTSSSTSREGGPQSRVRPSSVSEPIAKIKTSENPILLKFQPSVYFYSQRKRKLKCLELNPAGENQFATR